MPRSAVLGVERRSAPIAAPFPAAGHQAREAAHDGAPAPTGPAPTLVLLAITGGLLAVLALWWSDTPSVHGLGDYLTGAGRILGLMAGYGVVVLVALMARVAAAGGGVGVGGAG